MVQNLLELKWNIRGKGQECEFQHQHTWYHLKRPLLSESGRLMQTKMNTKDQQKPGPITINKTFQTLACKN